MAGCCLTQLRRGVMRRGTVLYLSPIFMQTPVGNYSTVIMEI